MLFDVYIQDNYYKVVEASDVTDVLKIVGTDIGNGAVPNFDKTKDHNIRIIAQDNA